MLLNIYATGDHGGSQACGPSLIVEAGRGAALPHHPTGKVWRYLATISDSDTLIASRRELLETALATRDFFSSRWALGVASATMHAPSRRRRQNASGGGNMSYQRQHAERAFRLPA